MYRRVFRGQVAPGRHGEFLAALEEALLYQQQRGIGARYSVWDALTGRASEVEIISEFESLQDLDRFEELVAQDQIFADIRLRVRAAMVFVSTTVTLYRQLDVSPTT